MASNYFYILKDSLSISPNNYGDANLIAVSTLGKSTITYYNIKGKPAITQANNDSYPEWTFIPYNVKLSDNLLYYVYAKCSKTTEVAYIYFTPTAKSIDGEVDYYYIPIGTIAAVADSNRIFTPDFGKLLTDQGGAISEGTSDMVNMFSLTKPDERDDTTWVITVLRQFLSLKVKGSVDIGENITVTGVGSFGSLKLNEKVINDFLLSTDTDADITDSQVMTALRVKNEFESILNKCLRKDIADTSAELITFLKGLSSKQLAQLEKGACFGQFLKGTSGAVIDENGDAEVRNFIARIKATITELQATTAKANTLDVSDKTTTLNLVVNALASAYNLNVDYITTLFETVIKKSVSSESFVSGIQGMQIYKALNGDWNMELDNLTVRKIFYIFELVVQKVTHQGGMVIRSAAGAKLTKVTDGGSYWKCEHDSTDDFVAGDQVLCQTFSGTTIKRYWRLVTSSGAGYFNLSKIDCEDNSGIPEKDDDVAVLGNRTVTARQKAQIDCAVGDMAPYRADYDNIDSYSLIGKLILRTGNLSGVVDDVFGELSGSGMYGKNVYLKGSFVLDSSGKSVDDELTDVNTSLTVLDGRITAGVSESKTYADSAAAAAMQGAIDDATGKYATKSDFTAQLQIIATQIAAKVSQADFNSLGQRVSTAEGSIIVQAEAIASKVEKTTVNVLTARIDSAEQKILPASIINTVLSTITDATSGGRNLLKNSDFSDGLENWLCAGVLSKDIDTPFMGLYPYKYIGSSDAIGYINLYQQVASLLKPNTKYTLSCYAKYSGNDSINTFGLFAEGHASFYSSAPVGDSDWKKYSATFTTPLTFSDVRVGWYFAKNVSNDCLVRLTMFKLEEGTSATDWTPSPADIASKSQITQLKDNINLSIYEAKLGNNLLRNTDYILEGFGTWIDRWFYFGDNDTENLAFSKTLRGKNIAISVNVDIKSVTSGYGYYYVLTLNFTDGTQQECKISGTTVQTARLTGTFTIQDKEILSISLNLMALQTGIVGRIYNPKIELGTSATSWTASPEDKPLNGINLIPNSENIKNISQKQIEGNVTYNVLDKDGSYNATLVEFTKSNAMFRIGQADANSILKLTENTYTYSVWVYPTVGTQLYLYISAMPSNVIQIRPNTWQLISFTLKIHDNDWFINNDTLWHFVDIKGVNSGDTFKVYHPKLETGYRATEWGYSPKDLVSKDGLVTSINLSKEGVRIKGDQIDITGTTSFNDNVKIGLDGILAAKGANIEGKVTASSGKIGKFSIIDGDIIGLDSSNMERVRFSSNPLPAISSLFTGYSLLSDALEEIFEDYFKIDTEIGIERTSITHSVRTDINLTAASTIWVSTQGGQITVLQDLLPVEYITQTDVIRAYNSSGVIIATGECGSPFNVNTTGMVTIVLESTFTIHNMSDGYRYYVNANLGWQGILTQGTTEKTFIGSDGLYSVFGSGEYIYFKRGVGLICKGSTNMPGILASGSVDSSGIQSNTWGSKVSAASVGKGGTGIFNVPHNVGNSSYTVNINCAAADATAYVSGKFSNSVQITVRKGGGNYSCGFDYTIIGSN